MQASTNHHWYIVFATEQVGLRVARAEAVTCSAMEQSNSEILHKTGFARAVGSFGDRSRKRDFRLLVKERSVGKSISRQMKGDARSIAHLALSYKINQSHLRCSRAHITTGISFLRQKK